MIDPRRFIFFLLILCSAIALQTRMHELVGVSFEFMFIALVVFAFFSSFAEEALLCTVAFFASNWRPGIAPELIILLAIPLGILAIHDRLPWQQGGTVVLASLVGISGYYAVALGISGLVSSTFVWIDVVGSAGIAWALFSSLHSLYYPRAKGFGSIYALPR